MWTIQVRILIVVHCWLSFHGESWPGISSLTMRCFEHVSSGLWVFWVSYKKAAWICCSTPSCTGFYLDFAMPNYLSPLLEGVWKDSVLFSFFVRLEWDGVAYFPAALCICFHFLECKQRKKIPSALFFLPSHSISPFCFLVFSTSFLALSLRPEPKWNLSFLSSCFCHIMPSGVIQSQIIFLCTSTSMARVLRDSAPTCTHTHPSTQSANQPTLPNLPPHRHQPQMGTHGTHLPSPPAEVVGSP